MLLWQVMRYLQLTGSFLVTPEKRNSAMRHARLARTLLQHTKASLDDPEPSTRQTQYCPISGGVYKAEQSSKLGLGL